MAREVDDIFLLLAHLDERKELLALPRFVCSGLDNMPSLRLYESDFKVLMNLISKLGDKVAEMGSGLAAIARDVREMQVKVSAPDSFPTLQQAQAQAAINSVSSQLRQQSQRSQFTAGKTADHGNSEPNPVSVVMQAGSSQSRSNGHNWASAVSTPAHASSNRFAVLASTTDDDANDNPFEPVMQRK